MVKQPKKASKLQFNTINSVPIVNNTSPKSKQQIDKEYYQKNKAKKKTQQKERYAKKKLQIQQHQAKFYEAENISVLMSLKEYTELNKDKKRLWADFCWTLKDCQKGMSDIVFIMKLREVAETLINDYWNTAKNEVKKGKSWNSLSEEQQTKLIKYWGREKARLENNYLTTAERLEKQSQEYLKDIEMAKFHEERGKIKCNCWSCEQQKQIREEIKAEQEKSLNEDDQAQEIEWVKSECYNCGEYKKVDSDNGLCKKCGKMYEQD